MRTTLIATALVALPLLAGCGSANSQPQVTQAQLSKALQTSGLNDPKLADCAAKDYVSAGISQDGLRLMANGKVTQGQDPSTMGLSKDDAAKAKTAVQKILTDCIK